MKRLLTLLCLSLSISMYAQTVELNKKAKSITVNNAVLRYKIYPGNKWSIYDEKGNEIIYFKVVEPPLSEHLDSEYFVLNFLNEGVKISSNDFRPIFTIFKRDKSVKKLVSWLVRENVLAENSDIDYRKLQNFASKYDMKLDPTQWQ